MCGIFGIISKNNTNLYDTIIEGLIQLQNRGYDSSGLCVLKNKNNDTEFDIQKYASTENIGSIDKLLQLNLKPNVEDTIFIGIGHNRWATHGMKNDINAHPHISNNGNFVLVHNGIIENYSELKDFLITKNYDFYSQTDTEVIVNLISYNYHLITETFTKTENDNLKKSTEKNTILAIQNTILMLHGTYGLIIINKNEPNKLFCVRNGSPLLIGENDDCVIITSEQCGFCNKMNHYITLNNDDIFTVERNEINMQNNMHIPKLVITCSSSNVYSLKNVCHINADLTPVPFEHWTLKEIHEQYDCVINAINKGGRIRSQSEVKLGGLETCESQLYHVNNIIILGCGTSYFAGLYGMNFLKKLCNFNTVQVFDGAEFEDIDIPKIGKTAFILLSQSGETKDLHRCIEIAKNNDVITIGIINVVDSLIAREVDCGIYCNAGKEVGVASTKSFTSQVVCLSLAAIWFSQMQEVHESKRTKMIKDLHNLANDFKNTIESTSQQVCQIAKKMSVENYNNMFLLGKGCDECIAKEGSLKIKEMSYVHSEGYSASSLKHGPFALLNSNFPVIILNLDNKYNSKILNCFEEVYSRNSPILFITNDLMSTIPLRNKACDILKVSENNSYASLLGIVPLQLLAYYLALNRGNNPDKPKNLAKVVTVE
jgi:glucosamine--fructose-6-phosphate aminotransferase (isomerizing)